MKKCFALLLALLFIILFCGCSKETENSGAMPENFAFSLTWNTYGISSYDSASGRLVKTTDATIPEDYVTTLELTESQLAEIWQIIDDLGIENYPEEFDPFDGAKSEPHRTIVLSTVIDGAQREIRCEEISLGAGGATKRGEAFLTAVSDSVNIIESTPEWRSLPDYEFLYD